MEALSFILFCLYMLYVFWDSACNREELDKLRSAIELHRSRTGNNLSEQANTELWEHLSEEQARG